MPIVSPLPVVTIKMSPDIVKAPREQSHPQLKTSELARGSASKRHTDRLWTEGLSSLLAVDKEASGPCHTGLSVGLFECPYNMAEGMVQGRAWKKLMT